jgi:hypothetical protein
MGHLKSQICSSSLSQQIKGVCQNASWLNLEILQEMFAHIVQSLFRSHLCTASPRTRFSAPLSRLSPLLREEVPLQWLQCVAWEMPPYLCPGLVFVDHLGQQTVLLLCQFLARLPSGPDHVPTRTYCGPSPARNLPKIHSQDLPSFLSASKRCSSRSDHRPCLLVPERSYSSSLEHPSSSLL